MENLGKLWGTTHIRIQDMKERVSDIEDMIEEITLKIYIYMYMQQKLVII